MPDPKLARFGGQKYMSVETFKKNGQGVKTPVWFVLHKNAFLTLMITPPLALTAGRAAEIIPGL